LFDFGAVADGYVSDMTRTVACGDPPGEMIEVYDVVLAAQMAALEGTRAGMAGPEADALARAVIESAGHGSRFGHSLGHGIGLEVHEAPRLSRKSVDRLATGMVVTVEPAYTWRASGRNRGRCVPLSWKPCPRRRRTGDRPRVRSRVPPVFFPLRARRYTRAPPSSNAGRSGSVVVPLTRAFTFLNPIERPASVVRTDGIYIPSLVLSHQTAGSHGFDRRFPQWHGDR
jgi:hypothetical protein